MSIYVSFQPRVALRREMLGTNSAMRWCNVSCLRELLVLSSRRLCGARDKTKILILRYEVFFDDDAMSAPTEPP